MTMKRNRTVASGSTIDGGGAISISPSRVQETGCGTVEISLRSFLEANLAAAYWRCKAVSGLLERRAVVFQDQVTGGVPRRLGTDPVASAWTLPLAESAVAPIDATAVATSSQCPA